MNQQLTNKEALMDALFVLYNQSKDEKRENIQRFIELCMNASPPPLFFVKSIHILFYR